MITLIIIGVALVASLIAARVIVWIADRKIDKVLKGGRE